MVMGFEGGYHLVIVKPLTFESIYQVHTGSGPESNFPYFGRARMDFDEDLNMLVIASDKRACLVTIAVKPPVSFFGNSGGKRHGLLFGDLLRDRKSFDTFETTQIDYYSELPIDGGPILSFYSRIRKNTNLAGSVI